MQTSTQNADILKRCRFLKVVFSRMGITRKVALPPPPDADPKRFKHSKQIIVSELYDDIVSFQNEVNSMVKRYSMPSFIFPGVVAVANAGVEGLDNSLRESAEKLPPLVAKLTEAWPNLVEEARQALNGQFNERDYLPPKDVARRFAIRWQWIAFDVPEGLPPELRKAEAKKLQERFAAAQEEILIALRTGFADIVAAAVDRLTVAPGEKPKIFRNSLVDNFREFFETFPQRNLMDDKELAAVVEQAKGLLANVGPNALRDSARLREKVATELAKVKGNLDKMITERAGRRFDFSEEN